VEILNSSGAKVEARISEPADIAEIAEVNEKLSRVEAMQQFRHP
jgi:hypothetical protein